MYSLPYFKTSDMEEVMRFMRAHPFITLCGSNKGGTPVATQVPILLKERDGKLFMEGHMMKNTDHHKAFLENPNALVIFTGAHTYVSASWYSDPNQASTWNYQSVHVRGQLRFLEEKDLLRILEETTSKYEKQESPASFKNLSAEYVNRLIKAIVAFEINVEEIGNVFKLSQNRDEKSFHTIMERLNQQAWEKAGLKWNVVEGPPTLGDKTKLGLEGRDEEIANFITFMKNLKQHAGIDVICYNWMPVLGWYRTSNDTVGRGGAFVTAFDYEEVKNEPHTKYGEVSKEKLWSNLEYFLKAVVPEAEKIGMKLAMHPDDPQVDSIKGISRIMNTVENSGRC